MHISKIKIKNFRGVKSQRICIGNYNIFVGENNSGKSNLLQAIRYFYDDIKITADDFYQKRNDNILFVEIEFDLSNNQNSIDYFKNEKGEKYLLSGNRIIVRKSAELIGENVKNEVRRGFLKETADFDKDNQFFGLKGVSKSMLGEIIYIPPLKDLKDEIKTTSQSTTMMKILKKIIHPKLKDDNGLEKINENIESFNDSNLFNDIENDLSELMKGYECNVKLEFEPVKVENIISSTTVNLIEEHLDKMPTKTKGTGIQRALLINLIKYWSEKEKNDKKTKTEPPTLLLFEEPEAFQHPQKQTMLFSELKDISSNSNQVFITSHSPHFVSETDNDLKFIIRCGKNKGETNFTQIKNNTLQKTEEAQRFKFWKWLDGEKNKIFFARKVILCEGNTEKMCANYLIKNNYKKDLLKQTEATLIDCGGKFNIPHFIRICNDLKIPYFLFYDLDKRKTGGNKEHDLEKANEEIKNEQKLGLELFLGEFTCDDDLEILLFNKKMPDNEKMMIIERIENKEANEKELKKIKESLISFID